jgi:hypothetical protein
MKLLRFCVIGLLPIYGVLANEEVIKSQSPDGKFALRLASAFGGSAASIIDTKSHAVVVGEDDLQVSTEVPNSDGETKLVWSADSKRVAYCYHEHNRNNSGTNVEVFIWNGSKFEGVNLPELPRPKIAKSTVDDATKHFERLVPLHWLKSGTLVLSYDVDVGDKGKWDRIVTIGFDAKDNATVQKVEQKKSASAK